LSKDIADATSRLGLGTLHEVQKSHPRDWENPGRVRVQWKKDGRLMNPAIKTSALIHSAITLCSNNSNLFRKTAAGDDILPDPTDKTR
jgi:signal recognition particle subunit SEC65